MMRTSNQESLFLKDVNPVNRYRCLHSGKILLALLRRPAVQLTLWLGQHVVGPTCSLGTSQEVCSHEGRCVGLPSSLVLPTAALETLQYLASSLVAVMIIELPQTINRRFIDFLQGSTQAQSWESFTQEGSDLAKANPAQKLWDGQPQPEPLFASDSRFLHLLNLRMFRIDVQSE